MAEICDLLSDLRESRIQIQQNLQITRNLRAEITQSRVQMQILVQRTEEVSKSCLDWKSVWLDTP